MFRIRRIHDDLLPLDRRQIVLVQQMLREKFPAIREQDITSLPEKLHNPFKQRFRSLLLVAEDEPLNLRGFAVLSHDPNVGFWFLDYLASRGTPTTTGVGGALYGQIRDYASATPGHGLFFECLPDDPAQVDDPQVLKQNVARLRFYERFGARPLANPAYQTPTTEGERGLPLLMLDDLDQGRPLRRDAARAVVRAILERKYSHLCTPEYVRRVVDAYREDPVPLRDFRYVRTERKSPAVHVRRATIALVINDRHDIHHIRERGYVEAPVRISAILRDIEPSGLFRKVEPREHGEQYIRAVHDGGFIDYLKRACASVPEGKSVYPYVFPVRNQTRPPKEITVRAGYYCIDTFTPLNRNAFPAARRAVDCTLTAAGELLRGERLAYALVRPPGHHAEPRAFGGFCYFNNAAIGAQFLSGQGRVALLDVDYHHGNGQERIFYERSDVLTISIHGHPRFAYPFFTGFEDEHGGGPGTGFNINYALPEQVDGERYRVTLRTALNRIRQFRPTFLVVALGLDPAKGDPTGTWTLLAADFERNGRLIGELRLPTLVVQEGGYRTRSLGQNARAFFTGLDEAQRVR